LVLLLVFYQKSKEKANPGKFTIRQNDGGYLIKKAKESWIAEVISIAKSLW